MEIDKDPDVFVRVLQSLLVQLGLQLGLPVLISGLASPRGKLRGGPGI